MPAPPRRPPDPDEPATTSLPTFWDAIADLEAAGHKVLAIDGLPPTADGTPVWRIAFDEPGRFVEARGEPQAETTEAEGNKPKTATTRGTGARPPWSPRAPTIPVFDRAIVAANRLSGFYRAAVDRVVSVYVQAMKRQAGHWAVEPRPDPTEGLAEWLEDAIAQERQLRAQVARAARAVEHAAPRLAPDDPKLRGRDEFAATLRSLSFAEVWFLLALHQLAPLAVAALLGLRVWPKHVGARMATLLIAHQALDKPWGSPCAASSNLPLADFPMENYAKVWEQLRRQAIEAVRRTVRTTKGLRDLLIQAEKAADPPDRRRANDEDPPAPTGDEDEKAAARPSAGRSRKEYRADVVNSAIYEQIIDTGLKEWEALSWQELDRMARKGLLNHAPRAIRYDLIDRMRARRPEESLSGGVKAVMADDGVPEAVAEPGALRLEKVSYDLAANPSMAAGRYEDDDADRSLRGTKKPRRSIEIVLVPRTPDQELEEKRRRDLRERLEADPRYQTLKAAIDAGARSRADIARHYGVDPRTLLRWITKLKEEFSG